VNLEQALAECGEKLVRQAEHLKMLRDIIAELRLPRTLDDFAVGSFLYIDDRTPYFLIKFSLLPNEDGSDRNALLAFGTIKKVRDALAEMRWEVPDGMKLRAQDWGKKLEAEIVATREKATLTFTFTALPEGPHCKLVEETIDVPASSKKVLRVVCDEPAAELPQPALMSPAVEVAR